MMYKCNEKSRAVCFTDHMMQSVSTHFVAFDINIFDIHVLRFVTKDKYQTSKAYLIYNAYNFFVHVYNITLMMMLYINYILYIWIVSQLKPCAMYVWRQDNPNHNPFSSWRYGKWPEYSFLRINQRNITYHLISFIILKKPKLQYSRNHRQILANQIISILFDFIY